MDKQENEKPKKRNPKKVVSDIPKKRQEVLRWDGWGYKDSKFYEKNGIAAFSGKRYPMGGLSFPIFTEWVKKELDVDVYEVIQITSMPTIYPDPLPCPDFRAALDQFNINYSDIGEDRLIRSHGQLFEELYYLRQGKFKRIPDLVVWPTCHEDCVQIVNAANQHNIVVIPFGGGTSVAGALSCRQNEKRVIIALDTSQMNRMLWVDHNNLLACFETGIVGQDLHRELKKLGLTCGHEPDSYEFSTLGGWVATRASGMKRNVYGNIEDLVVSIKMVTTKGVLEKNVAAPRISCGPDFNHIIFGSEGTLGVITEVVLKVFPLPEVVQYGSLAFPDFESGILCLREIAKCRIHPSSIRLMDNDQFVFGHGFKIGSGIWGSIVDGFKKFVITKIKGFDLNKMSVATLVFEGDKEDCDRKEKTVIEIAKKYGGLSGGSQNGERGYVFTFVIAYIRDLAMDYGIASESFETSCSWDRCASLCNNVKRVMSKEMKLNNVLYYTLSCRVTQSYDAGCAVYFYFGYNSSGQSDPVSKLDYFLAKARDAIIDSGGSISHHHGVGKHKRRWYPHTVSDVGAQLYRATKEELDPKNIFTPGNFLDDENTTDYYRPAKL